MTTQLDMDEQYRRDYRDKDRMRELRQTIEAFLGDPPSRCYAPTLSALTDAVRELCEDEARTVAVWD